MMRDWVIVNGAASGDGRISIDDRGFTLGDGLFETIPLYGGAPYLLDRHLARLRAGAGAIRLAVPFGDEEVGAAMDELARKNGVERGAARLTVTRGVSSRRGYGIDEGSRPSWTLSVRPYEPLAVEEWEAGLVLAPVSIRKNPLSPLSGIKGASALERVLILDEAARAGASEALALTVDGFISSPAASNIFWAAGGRLYTPSIECAILPGVTRGRVMEIAREEGIETVEGRFRPEKLESAEEVFITNSLLEIAPVRAVSGLFAADGPGPLTRLLAERYRGSASF
ncbi:MAG: aminotransferase class IV [Candidatus Nitrospinota bacterium M3_3B_026]